MAALRLKYPEGGGDCAAVDLVFGHRLSSASGIQPSIRRYRSLAFGDGQAGAGCSQ